jgi:mono/diheme cytochrome c family protein
LYYNEAKVWNDKLGGLAPKDPKTKEYEAKVAENFKKAVGYFETSYDIAKDAATKKTIRQIYLRLGDNEKADKYK